MEIYKKLEIWREKAEEGSYAKSENKPATSQQARKIRTNKPTNQQTNKLALGHPGLLNWTRIVKLNSSQGSFSCLSQQLVFTLFALYLIVLYA